VGRLRIAMSRWIVGPKVSEETEYGSGSGRQNSFESYSRRRLARAHSLLITDVGRVPRFYTCTLALRHKDIP
jgi:hypothetical protein